MRFFCVKTGKDENMIDYSKFQGVTVGTSTKGGNLNTPVLRYTHVSNTRRFYINKQLAEKLGMKLIENDNVIFQIELGKNEDGNDAIFICKKFGDNVSNSRASVKNGIIVFYSTHIGNWIEERIGEVEVNKTVAFADIDFDTFNDNVVAIINLPVIKRNDNYIVEAEPEEEWEADDIPEDEEEIYEEESDSDDSEEDESLGDDLGDFDDEMEDEDEEEEDDLEEAPEDWEDEV